ncbi:methionine ABC transporter ATP-binding protein [Halothermothrix orenii]|uniref:ABC transporter related n=1 Tax=Halothermothrix orenii (strain H 168 / OCM 544 / DSM 9562) TaxID=373903 RepID=B8D0N9_HALOH|nr:methionine ABC transporter ATP-binding protein [Halothermothrix orenii]ACL70975.1 ABC transporter related [Halothermothrix orenii H 168]
MVVIKNLVKEYNTGHGKVTALKGINLRVREGEIFGIIGPSGAGKSTLIRTINLLEKPTSGEIYINGVRLTSLKGKTLRKKRQKIGMIFQHFNLLNSRTVRGNISFPLEIAGVPAVEREERVERLMELVGLGDRADHYPSQLSGGQKQRVGIARALANNPDLLLSDEATSSLDPESTESILNLLSRIREEMNLTIILITHEMEVIKQICDRVAVIEGGKIIEEGKVIDVFASPQAPLTRRFIKSVINFDLSPRVLEHLDVIDKKEGKIIRLSFVGEKTHKPLISSLVRKYKIDANILYGNVDDIKGVPFGTLVLKLEGDITQIDRAIKFLRQQGLKVEVLTDDRPDRAVGQVQ